MLKRCVTLLRQCVGAARRGIGAVTVAVVLVTGVGVNAAVAAPDAAIIVDAKSGKVLYADNPDAKRYPASLTKVMTLYLLFEAIESGKTSLDSRITMSAFAASQSPSKLGLKAGGTITVRDAILSLVTKSANDVAVAIAEHVSGSEKAFAALMTRRAHDLGMSKTVYRNASGLPNSGQITTARDLATLARAIRDHYPQYYAYFSKPSFVWKGRRIANHNRLLGTVDGVNGIKTGYTRASGYNLMTSVDRGGRQVVGVVLGGESGSSRDKWMSGLIETYITRATRGVRTAKLMPGRTRNSGPPAAALVANAETPIPNLRPAIDGAEQVAAIAADEAAAPLAAAAAPMALLPPEQVATPPANALANLIGANSLFALDAVTDEGDAPVAGDDVPAVAETVPPPALKGWRIQISASPTEAAAEELLDQAIAKGGKILAKASPYTQPVQSGSTTLYRARFAGFADKAEARAACTYLTKLKFSCLAVAN